MTDNALPGSSDINGSELITPSRPRPLPGRLVLGGEIPSDSDDEAFDTPVVTGQTLRLAETPEEPSLLKAYYLQNGCSVDRLFSLCIGLVQNGSQVISLDDEPFKSMVTKHVKRHVIPKLSLLRYEVSRRAVDITKIKPKNWSSIQCMEWLEGNPVTNSDDVVFLLSHIAELKELYKKTQEGEVSISPPGKQWREAAPFLRLMHCLCEMAIKAAYLARYNRMSQSELDAQNSEVRPL